MATATKRPNVSGMIRRFPRILERFHKRWEALNEEYQELREYVSEINAAIEQQAVGTSDNSTAGNEPRRVGRPSKATTSGATTGGVT